MNVQLANQYLFQKGNTPSYSPQYLLINSLYFQVKSQDQLFQELDFPAIFQKQHVEFPGVKQEISKTFRGNKNITKNLVSFPRGATQLCRISRVVALFCPEFPKVMQQTQKFPWFFKKALRCNRFSGIAQFTNNKPISDEIFVSVQSWTTLFYIMSSS